MISAPTRVLLVDDDENFFVLVREYLARVDHCAYEVDWVNRFENALATMPLNNYDAFLVDYRLNGDNGIDLIERAISRGCTNPAILITGMADPSVDQQALNVGAADFLAKDSINSEVLERSLRYSVDRAKRIRHENEFRAAREIQQRLLPTTAPEIRGFDLAGRCESAEMTGGDFFDFFPSAGDCWVIAGGDVSGHDLKSTLVMVQTRAVIRSLATTYWDLGNVLTRSGRLLFDDLGDDSFVAIFLAMLNPESRELFYASAGHPAYIIDRNGELKQTLASANLPIGLDADQEYETQPTATLDKDDVFAFFTDGFTECFSPDHKAFGRQRVLDIIAANRHLSAKEIIAQVFQATEDFSHSSLKMDDMTMVVLRGDDISN